MQAFDIHCVQHGDPLKGKPRLTLAVSKAHLWTFDLSDMYCEVGYQVQEDCSIHWQIIPVTIPGGTLTK